MYFVSITIGLILVISSLFLIRREFDKAIHAQARMLEQSRLYKDSDLFSLLEDMQGSIDEMNRAFYEIAADLEGKYSIHEKELNDLNECIAKLNKGAVNENKPTPKPNIEQASSPINSEQVKTHQLSDKETKEKEVIKLRSQGKSPAQIAKDLNMGIGEVQLFLRIKH